MKLGLQCFKLPSIYCPTCFDGFDRDGRKIMCIGCEGITYYYHPTTGHNHRLNGPAFDNIRNPDHSRWFIDGYEYTEAQYKIACEALTKQQ
jgi:hypothetical protein